MTPSLHPRSWASEPRTDVRQSSTLSAAGCVVTRPTKTDASGPWASRTLSTRSTGPASCEIQSPTWLDEVQRLVLHERTERSAGGPLGLHGAISERLAHAEAVGNPVGVAAFYLDDGSTCGTHETTKAFLEGFWKTGLKLNPQKFACISAKPSPSSAHLTRASVGCTIRHDRCFSSARCHPTAFSSAPNRCNLLRSGFDQGRWSRHQRPSPPLTSLCNNLWASYSHTESLMAQATKEERITLLFHQVPGSVAWLVGGSRIPSRNSIRSWERELGWWAPCAASSLTVLGDHAVEHSCAGDYANTAGPCPLRAGPRSPPSTERKSSDDSETLLSFPLWVAVFWLRQRLCSQAFY